jgi:hypothetical protein
VFFERARLLVDPAVSLLVRLCCLRAWPGRCVKKSAVAQKNFVDGRNCWRDVPTTHPNKADPLFTEWKKEFKS